MARKVTARYDECYAKVLLENMLPERFKGLELKDRPDLWDTSKKVGVEVTGANSSRDMRVRGEMDNLVSGKHPQKSLNILNTLGVAGAEEIENALFLYSEDDTNVSDILNAVKNKIQKLNKGGYEEFQQYDLYIYTHMQVSETDAVAIFPKISVLNVGPKKYSYLYLLSGESLYVFDFACAKVRRIKVPLNRYDLALEAQRICENI